MLTLNFQLFHDAPEVTSDTGLIVTQISVILCDREAKVQRDLLVASASDACFQNYELGEKCMKSSFALLGPI
jgi:hypothetical protein